MATKLYMRTTFDNAGTAAELSTALPVGTFVDGGWSPRDLTPFKGSLQSTRSNNSLAQTAHQDIYIMKFASPRLASLQIDANTWTVGVGCHEANVAANAFAAISLYVLKSDNTVRGYVYDSDAALGTEWPVGEAGRVFTFVGAAVTGVEVTDRLVMEFWIHLVQADAVARVVNIYINGTVEPTEGTATTDAASYISTPQNIDFVFNFPPKPQLIYLRRNK